MNPSTIEYRAIRPDEIGQVDDVFDIAFLQARNDARPPQSPDRYRLVRGAFDETGRMQSCVFAVPYRVRYEGHAAGMTGIGGVSSRPEARRGGHIRSLIALILRESYARGDVFSALYPFSHAYYRQFGYELCVWAHECIIPLAQCEAFPRPAHVRQCFPGEAYDDAERVYARFTAHRNLACDRTDDTMGEPLWRGHLRPDPFRTRVYRYMTYDEQGEPEGYLCVTPKEHEGRTLLHVTDSAWVSPAALRRLIGYCWLLNGPVREIRWTMPDDVKPLALFPEPYDINARLRPVCMARAVNVQKALRMRETAAPYTLRVSDPLLPENNAAFSVCPGGQAERLQPGSAPADMDVSIQAFSQLALGALSLDEALLTRGDVCVRGNESALRAAYPGGCTFIGDYF